MTPQEKSKILEAISDEIRKNGPIKLAAFTGIFESRGFSRSLYANKGPKRWLTANFPELEIGGIPGSELVTLKSTSTTIPGPPVLEMKESVRQRFLSILSAQMEMHGMVMHSNIHQLIPEWVRYRHNGEKLGVWLSRTFRENEFTTRLVNNAAALLLPQTAADIDRIVQITNEMIRASNVVPVSSIAAKLKQENLKWESIPVAHNQTLGEWLADYCPGIFHNDFTNTVQLLSDDTETGPASISDTTKQNIVYRYVFLPTIGSALTALRTAIGDMTYATAAWKKQSISVFYDNLVGVGDGFLYDDNPDAPRLAFYTGLQSEDGQHIYCILLPNNAESAVQLWRYECFCYPGQDDADGYGRWLCQRFGLTSENRDAISVTYDRIEEALDEITGLQSALLPYFDEVGNRIRQGDPIIPGFSSQLARYVTHWESILTVAKELGISIPEEGLTMAYIQDILNEKDHISTVLEAMRSDYEAIVTAAWHYLDETAGVLYDDADPVTDIGNWDRSLTDSQIDEDAIKTAVSDLLEPFRAMRRLVRCSFPLKDDEARAREIVETHFRADLLPKYIRKYFIEVEDNALDFLDKIDDIEKRLKQIQIHNGSPKELPLPRLEDAELVSQVLSSENIHLIYNHYPALNKFESAVVSGDHPLVQRIAGNTALMTSMGYSEEQQETINQEVSNLSSNFSTPILTAGLNLIRLQGNTHRQAEKYLLLAIALKDGNAAIHLADLYARENNARLLWEIYQVHGTNFPVDDRQRLLPLLIDRGYIQVPQIISTDILGFLAIQDIAALDRFCHSPQLSEDVSRCILHIRRAIQEPFIRQIVFLDSELYRFIQQQENIDSIQSLGIAHTQETLGELLQLGNYPRGQDILSTARRLWHFVRDWNEVAENTAKLAEDSLRKAALLWEIYQHRKDSVHMLDLLRRNPDLQTLYAETYSNLLFASGSYQEYFEVFAGTEAATARIQLQLAVCAIHLGRWDGCIPENLTADDVTNNIDVITLLTSLMAHNGMTVQLSELLQIYFEPIMLNCSVDVLEQIVTAGGHLDEITLRQLQEQAVSNDNTALAVFLSGIVGSENAGHHDEAYFTQLWDSLSDATPRQQAEILRKMQILFKDRYDDNYSQLFPYLLRSTLAAGKDQPEDITASVIEMLTEESCREDSLPQILDILSEFRVAWDPAVQAKIQQLCATGAQEDICLRFFHAHRDEADGKADRILVKLYYRALEQSAMPQEYLAEAETVCLRHIRIHQDMTAAWCVYHIEGLLERALFRKFALLYIQNLSDIDEYEPEDNTSELTIFREVLEDPACNIDDYLQFCSDFGLFTNQDQQTVEELLPAQGGALTETESIPLLHGFYENSRDFRYLSAVSRLPLRDNPRAYARLLFHCARNAGDVDKFWNACISYCEKFRMDDILIDALIQSIRNKNLNAAKYRQWFDGKNAFKAVRTLSNRPEGFPALSHPERVRELLEEMCVFFIRIDANSTSNSNHNSLRTIIELAVASGNDDIVVDRLMDKLLGLYTKLGLAFACHLLRRGRYEGALRQFQALRRSYNQITYRELVEQLSEMSCSELEEWVNLESSGMLLDYFLLPDGNRPDTDMLRTFTMACITQNRQHVGIQVAEQLIRYFENDSVCYKVLFVLCKDHYMEYLPQIQKALAGLYTFFPVDRKGFYTRSRDCMLTLLTITDAVMQQLGSPRVIDNLSDFIHRHNIAGQQDLIRTVTEQNTLHENIRSEFIGLDDQHRTLLAHCLLGCVTANWFEFVDKAYQAGICAEEFADYLRHGKYCSWGLTRGVLQMGYGLSDENREQFRTWILETAGFFDQKDIIKKMLLDANLLLKHNDKDEVDLRILNLPWEEHFVCLGESAPKPPVTTAPASKEQFVYLGESAPEDEPEVIDSCYAWLWDHLNNIPQGCSIQKTLFFFARLAQDSFRFVRLFRDTERCFRQGGFALAGEIYEYYENSRIVPRDLRYIPEQEAQQIRAEFREHFQARKRLSKLFLGDAQTIAKFRVMKVHSCANIVITLLQSSHALKLSNISQYFRSSNQRLCRAILDLVNPAKTDAEKLSIYNAFDSDSKARLVLSRILSTNSKENNGYMFTQSLTLGNQMAAEFQKLIDGSSKTVPLLRFFAPINDTNAFNQVIDIRDDEQDESEISYGPAEADNSATETHSEIPGTFVPAFVIQESTALREEELPPLETLRQQLAKCAFDDYEQRLYCAHGIYRLVSRKNDDSSPETAAALLQFGLAYRHYHLDRLYAPGELTEMDKNHSLTLARQALMDMAYFVRIFKGRITGAPIINYEDGLRGILCHDFSSIDELVDDYRTNRDGYQALFTMITDSEIRKIVEQIFQQIMQLEQHYNTAGPRDQNTSSYRAVYKAAYDALEQIPFHMTWNEAKNTLLKHLMRAINAMDKRPFLDVRVLNVGEATRNADITGVMSNTGRIPAENISVQAIFGNGKSSDIYGYKELLPGEKICFAVPITASQDAVSLSYTLNITYHYRDKEYFVDPYTDTLTLTEAAVMTPDVDLYGAHKKLYFSADAEGQIVSKGFYGRADQKERLRRLAPEGAEFRDFSRAVVQGFRRTGKTSLLYYFQTYISSKFADKAIPIYVDCEGFSTQYVQKAFVSSVLYGVEFQMPHLTEKESWNRLKNTWLLPEDAKDRNPDTLQFFYQALGRELDGKGVVLIVDEVDRLFSRVDETQGAASSLFPSLRAVQHNPDCIATVCMVLCGSNNMLVYNQDQGKLYQMFQDFPKITVGQLNKEDIHSLLTEPLAETGQVEYHPDAIEWIWRYTGGLAWYTKLLGNAAVKRVMEAGRKCIYPIDISHAFDTIVNDKNCKQFIDEGCNDDAKLVLDAVATLATRYGADVTLNQLKTLLDGALTENQLDSSLTLLTDTLGLLERSSNNRNAYHFAVEIYRRIYRTLNSRFKRTEALVDRLTLTEFAFAPAEELPARRVIRKNKVL